jgi:tRNA (guanosine-2'-O-)-methyltransferase
MTTDIKDLTQPEYELLDGLISEERKQRMIDICAQRLQSVTAVFEQCHDPHNMGAVVRSAENFGMQQIHFVNGPMGHFQPNKTVSISAQKWVDHTSSNSIANALTGLKEQGFKVYGTHLSKESIPMTDLDFSTPCALLMGNEKDGLTDEALSYCDQNFSIPAFGMSQSLNISVAFAIAAHYATWQRRLFLGKSGDLPVDVQSKILRRWTLQAAPNGHKVLASYRKQPQ